MGRKKYRTDKEHYLPRYQDVFSGLFSQPVKLLELGVYQGGSLEMWYDLFPLGEIYGIDHNTTNFRNPKARMTVFQGKQEDTQFLRAVVNKTGPLDIVIDDASHIGDLTRKSFRFLFNYLKRGGWYVIEDWGTGYWDNWPDGKQAGNMVDLVKGLIDEMGIKDRTQGEDTPRFEKVVFFPAMACVKKG